MTWPSATDYNAAVQNPLVCFRDEELCQGEVVGDLFGLPRPHSGSFADVYQVIAADKQNWAIKCFTRPVAGLHPRYQAISDHLRQTQRAFMVDFCYLDEGICIKGQWYPLVKMRWIEGLRLNDFIREQLDKPVLLDRLAQMWIRLAQELRDARMVHGDLQHGNVLLVPGSKSTSLALKLIDYDGMYVPALADRPSGEVGHPNYQHPQRLREGTYNDEMDRFSHLLIYTTLRVLRRGGAELWQRYDNLENLLFREEDFRQPAQSPLLRELWQMKDREVHPLVGHLILASQGPLTLVPTLDELLDDSGVRPLNDIEEAQLAALFDQAPARPRRQRIVVPAGVGTASAPEKPSRPETMTAITLPTSPEINLSDTQIMPRPDMAPVAPSLPAPAVPRSFAEIVQDGTPPTGETPSRLSIFVLDLLVAILSRPAWLAALGTLALLGFVVINVLVWSSVKQPPPAPPIRPRPALRDIADVVLKGGHRQEVTISVERKECHEPLTLRFEGLPADMHVPLLTLGVDAENATLPLLAPLGIGPPERIVHVSLWQGEEKMDEKSFRLAVRKVPRPLLNQPENLTCTAGGSTVFAFKVERNDCPEPLHVALTGLPEEVRQEELEPAPSGEPRIKLTVTDSLKPQLLPVNLVLRVADARADVKAFLLTIKAKEEVPAKQEPTKARLNKEKLAQALTLTAGKVGELPIALERGGQPGNVEVRMEGLPSGVTALPVVLPQKQAVSSVILETALEAEAGRFPVKVKVKIGEQTVDVQSLQLILQKPHGKEERVRFHTLDHVELAGTLYHGWKGKRGLCVLMLHDLGQHRGTPGWKHLAEALQAEGHTVLAFDFRGHGESKKVTAKFWEYSVNKFLPAYDPGQSPKERPTRLEASDLPGEYLPWLVHDIAAARTYLDVRHDEEACPVNTFNLVILGAGQATALGSLWLASEGVRFNAAEVDGKTVPKPPEKLSVLQAAWIGVEPRLRDWPFDVKRWILWSFEKPPYFPEVPELPITFFCGAQDKATENYLEPLLRMKIGKIHPIPKARWTGQRLLDQDPAALADIQQYLVKRLKDLPPQKWVPRKIKPLRSYWAFPPQPGGSIQSLLQLHFIVAKRPGETDLLALPMERFEIAIKGLERRPPVKLELGEH